MTGVDPAGLEVVALHERLNLLEEVAKLINRQWPRSMEARKHSIQESCDELPCSLILVETTINRVCGHVRILRVNGKRGRALVESLLVAPEMRGRGLGRKLMVAAENHVRRLGYEVVHLSTHDQHAFYKHIGYTDGTSVSGERKCNANIVFNERISTSPSLDNNTDVSNTDVSGPQLCSSVLSSVVALPTALAPPPPPPPPIKVAPIDENTVMKWYLKQL